MLEGKPMQSNNKEYSSMMELVEIATKTLRRIQNHAKTCRCCREVLEKKE